MTTKIFFIFVALIICSVSVFTLYKQMTKNSSNTKPINTMSNTPVNSKSANIPQLEFSKSITIGKVELMVAVADTSAKQAQGLSGQTNLPNGTGMLFDYKNSSRSMPGFWMRQMNFDIDILWIRDGAVVDISEQVPAPKPGTLEKDLPRYYPKEEIDTVVEVPAGWVKQNSVTVGTKVNL